MMGRATVLPPIAIFFIVFLASKLVNGAECPNFPKKLSLNCAPHSTVDQCKFDADCTESKDHKCCLIGCQKMCLDPSLIEMSIQGASVCPVLPRPSSCPNKPNECSDQSECSDGRKCCSDGCRMACAAPVVVPTTVAPKTFPWKSCNASVDVAFIIDSSGSINRRNYVKIKSFVKNIARSFGISPSESQAGIVLYSTDASVKAHFGQYPTTKEFVKAVDGLPHERGFTFINRALKLAASEVFPRARKNVPKVAMLLTDGKQTDPTGTVNLKEASAPLRDQGVRVIVFGVGKSINVRELRLTVERDEDVIKVMKFDDLTTKVREYTAHLCQAAETEPIHPDADIIFLIDSSTDVSSQQFDTEKQFVRRMVRYFMVSPLGPRAAFVSYATTSYTVIGFSGYSSTADFSLQINRAPFLGGRRRIDQALIHTAKMFRETGRVGLRIVILLTAGNYYMGTGARSISFVMSQLRSLDTHMYVIGIGPYFTPSMFTPMVRGPSDIFEVPSFKDLTPWQSKIARQLRLSTNAFKYEPAYWRADVIFLMDSSRYVTANNYILEKNFVKLMARLLNLASNRSRTALFTFSDNPQLEIAFDGYQDREAFDAAVNKAPQLEGNRRIDKAFQSAAELLRTKSRASVPKYVILLTTGKQTRQSDTRSLADTSRNLRSYGGRVFVVAILTGGYAIRDFYTAVQRPEDAFSVASFTDLLPRVPSMAARVMASWRAPAKPNFAADIAFIVDSSSSVSPFQYTRSKRFIRILSDYLNVAPGKSRGAMVTFGETPVVVFSFDSYKLLSEFRTQVNDAPYLGGEPSISTTLSAAGTLFSDARGSYPWIVILLTSWRPDDIRDSRRLEVLARPLLSRGVWLYVLSIGENPYVGWLRPMLVEPRDAFSVVSYRDLPGNVGPLASYIVNDNYLYGDSWFQVDILFLMDTSEDVNLQDYKIEKHFIQRIALHLGIFTGRSRGALVAYGANSLVVFGFGGYDSNSEFVRRLNDAPMFGGEKRVDRALDTAAALMLGARSTIPKVVVLIMAGQHSADPDAMSIKDAASPLSQLGAWLYVMAIGPIDPRELQKATIRSTDVFFARSFSGLLGYITPMARYIANTSVIAGTSPLNADIVFAIDCSSSVPYREYGTEKSFVRSLAQYLNIQQSQSRAALVVYGGRVFTVIRLERSQSFLRFDSALTRAPYLGGLRRYDKALDIARDIFTNARENVPKVMLLFMAGSQAQATGAKSLQDTVKPLRQQGITTFIFRIGSEPEQRELLSAVDRPGNVVTFSSFADMDARVPYVARQIPFYSALLGPPSFAVDVVYLIDSSDPVTQYQYGDQKEFVKYLARYLNTMPSRTRGAVITYGSTATLVTNLGIANTTQAFDKAVDSAAKVGGERRMDRAVDAARGVFLSKARPAFAKVAILLTSGDQPAGIQYSVLKAAFQRLYDLGARLYVVTIDLPAISLPLADWFPVRSFRDLPIQVLPLARHAALDTASLGPNKFVADVIFMLDSSSRVTPEDYLKEKEFVKLIARYLNITPGKSRGSVIIFSTAANPILPFSGYTTMSEFNAAIDRASQLSGNRRLDRAFGVAATLFQNARPDVLKIAIVLTGGMQSPEGGSLQEAMQTLRNMDVVTYVIAVGAPSDVPVERPEDIFMVTSYGDLPGEVQQIARNISKRRAPATPAAKITTTPTSTTAAEPTTTITTTPKVTQTPTTDPKGTTPAPTTPADPCETEGCNAPYSIGCRVVNNQANCVCPKCPVIRRPVCASDGVQDLSECLMKKQACEGDFNVTVAKQGPCDKECRAFLDIAFIVDSSGSIGRWNWERMKRFVKSIVSQLDVSSSTTRIAVIAYSTDPEVVMLFRNFQGTDMVNRVVDNMRWQRGLTYTDKALLLADRSLFQTSNGMRLYVPKLAVVITDGRQTTTGQYTELSVASRGIKTKGVTVYAVGVGSGADRTELEEIASRPEYVLMSSSFEELQSTSSGMTRRLCEEATPIPTTTPTPTPNQTTPAPTSPDPCEIKGCSAPYNIGCQVVDRRAQCICPTCRNFRKPVCASDGVQDLTECHLKRQACQADMNVTVAKHEPCDKVCSDVMDIAFLIDSSGSVGRTNWVRMKRFVKSVISSLDVSSSTTRIAAIAYSTNSKIVWRFIDFQGTDMLNRVLDQMVWQRGYTYIDKALLLADRSLFQTSNGMRLKVPKFAVVITDGKQTTTEQYTRLSVASRGMKNKGVTVYVVGIGSGVKKTELDEIASGPEFVLTSSSFEDLPLASRLLTRGLCEVPTTTATIEETPTPTPRQTTKKVTATTPDPCQTRGCTAPYNIGCQVVDNKAECICPTCPRLRRPVCASDDVQDLTECHLKQQSCWADMNVTVAKQGPCEKECSLVVDIAFIIDSSGSIGRKNWELMKRFVKSIVSKLDVRSSAVRVAAIVYSTNPQVVMLFRYFQGTDEINRLFDRMRWERGYTYTDKALLLADSRLFQTSNGMRPGVRKLAVVITDGKQTTTGQYTRLSVASRGVKNKGVTVYAVGVGSGADQEELEEIASKPEYVFISSSFRDLSNVSKVITRLLCDKATPSPREMPTTSPKQTTPSPTTAEATTTTTTKVTQTTTGPKATTPAPTPAPTIPDPCKTEGCNAPYNIGCQVVNNRAQCICPSCSNIRRPVCASDGVQDLSECHLRQQACQTDLFLTIAKPGPCDKECSLVVDIAFIIDSSGSIGRKNWELMKRFVKSVVSKLDVRSSAVRVAAIAYSTNPQVVMLFRYFQGTDEINRLFDRMRWQRGYTYTDKALLLADSRLFQTSNGMRPSVRKLAVVITDGKQTTTGQYTRLSVASRGIKNKGVTVYAVGVGSGADQEELEEIASKPEYVFISSSFRNLQNVSKVITRLLCDKATPSPREMPTTTPKQTTPSPTTAEPTTTTTTTTTTTKVSQTTTGPKATTPAPTTPDPCKTEGCNAPYNIGCQVVNNRAQCICPSCSNIRRPVCASDGVQDLSECHLRQQACQADLFLTIAKPGPCDKECSLVVDIAFIIDSSGSIGRKNWELMKRFVKSIVSKLDVRSSAVRVAAIAYSTNPQVVMLFRYFQGTDEINRLFDRMRWQRGYTYTDKALLLADSRLFQTSSGMRPSVRKLAVVITDGKQTTTGQYTRLSVASRGVKTKGVTVYAVGVGSGADQEELEEIASKPEYVFISLSFRDLHNVSKVITRLLCDKATPTPREMPITTPKQTTTSPTTAEPTTTTSKVTQTTTVPKATTPAPTIPDPCKTEGCNAPYNIGCQVVSSRAQCVCPSCSNIRRPVCASDGVQDLSECHLRQQACQADLLVTVAKTGPCAKVCQSDVDIAFLIDSSGSIGRKNWERMKRFVKSIVSKFDVSSSAARIAAIAYSTNPQVVMLFRYFQGTDEVNRLFDRMRWQRGSTYTDKALLLADSRLFQISNGMRPGVRKVAVVITDGAQTKTGSYTRLSVASQGLKGKGVTVYAVGIGSGTDKAELAEISSGPEYVSTSLSFKDLQSISLRLIRELCQESTTTTTTQTTTAPKVTTPARTTAEPTTTAKTPKVTQTTTAPVTTPAPTTPDPCKTEGCNAPYNIGCRVVNNRAQCICPSCPNTRNPVCASDGVQDMSECHLKQQACLGDISLTVARQGPCDKECRSIVDIAFIIDSSGSIGRKNWERMKRFVKSVVSKLDVSPSATQVAIIAYSTNPIVEMRFWNTQRTDYVNQLIDNIPWQRGYTNTDKALQLADSDLFQTGNGMRVNVPKLAVVITDGKQTKRTRYTRLSVASRGTKDKGVTVYAVGVGSGADKEELHEIASEAENVLTPSSFKDLQNISLGLTKRLCAVPTPMVKGTLSSTPKLTTPVPTLPDPCQTVGCSAPYNIGCRVVNHQAQCVCPTCPSTRNPVCASDGVQDLSECYLRRQACLGDIAVTVVRQGLCARECFSVVDIAFIVDSSGSIGRRNWEKLKRFVKSIVSRFDVGFSATHVAVIAYSTNPVVEMRFWNTQSTDEVIQVIDKIPWQRGLTYSNKALELADRDIFTIANGMRPEVPKLAVVITDGPQTSGPHTNLSVASQGIKRKGVNVFVVGVGLEVPQKELEEMASRSNNVYRPRYFKNLHDLSPKIAKSLCDAVPSSSTPSSIRTTTLKVTATPTTPDPCQIERCTALYSIGCQVVQNKAQCICPSCPNIKNPVCASDDVQDLSECHMKKQACQGHITAFVEKEGPCDKECRSLVDIAFIIDSSGSIGRSNWEKMKRFLKAVVSKLEVSPSATHVAAVAYSTTPEIVMRFSDEQDTDQVNRVFDGIRWQRGLTRIDQALLLADKDLFQTSKGMRASVAKIAIVITDGKQTTTGEYTGLSKASEGIKRKDVTVYAVGVGKNVNEDELKEIATSPDYVLTSNSFTALQAIAPQIRKAVCDDPKVKYSADVLFIMDSSGDTISTYNTEKDLVKRLARYLDINPEGTRAALAVFNGRPKVITDFESFRSTSDFESAVDRAPHLGGNRSVSIALRSAGKMFDSPSSVSKVIFLVTSGKPLDNEDGSLVGDVIDKLSSLGVRTYVVLVGPIHNPGKFRSMVEDPENVFTIDSQEDISKQINQVGSHVIIDSVTPKEKNLTMYVLFIVDSSTDVSASNFTEEKELVKSLISELNIDPANSGSRVGIMAYSNEATMILDFQNRENKSSLEEIIDNIPQLPGPRRIDNALKAAVNAFEDVDIDSPRFVVLLAAGKQTDEAGSDSFSAAVRPLHYSGTKTHVMAIGDDVDPGYFQAEDQEKTNVVSVPTFSDLPQKASKLAGDLVNDYVSQEDPARPTGNTIKLTTTRPTTTTEPGTTSTSPDDKVESSSPSDIVFLIDTSDGVIQSDLRQQKEFVKLVAQRLGVSPSHSHAAVLGYSDEPRLSGGFYSHLRGESFQEVADSVTLSGGKRNIQEALRQAKTMLNMARPTVPRVVFLITYGQQAPDFGSPRLQETAQSLRDMGADLYVIGVGVDENDPQLQKVVKRPDEFFKIPTSSDLQSYAQLIAYYAASGFGLNVPQNYKVEVVYVLDSSSFVGPENYKLEKEFTKALARVLNHNPNYTQSAVITFGSLPDMTIRMGSHRDLETFSQAVDNLRYLGGNSNLDFAVAFAARAFSTDDPKVPNIVIVVSNKDPSSKESVDMLAGTLRREGKIINVVGVGDETDFPNLRRLAGRSDNMFTPKSFSNLMSFAPKVASNILADTLPPTTPSTASTATSKITTTDETTTTIEEATTSEPATLSTQSAPAESTSSPKPPSTTHSTATASTSRITPSLANREKPGSCPYIPRPPSCSSRSRQCNYDNECTGDLKCCDNGCGKICVSTSYTSPTVALQANRCPSYSPNRQCSSSVQDECVCHSDCDQDNSYKCCFDGCRRLCRKTEAPIQCVRGVDIAFLMDSSESITEEDFEREKTAVKEIAGSFLNASRDSRAGVIMYSGQAELSVDFVGQRQFEFFASAVDALAHRRSMTRIDRALRYTSNTLFANPRPSVISIAVVMTDGVQTPDPGLEPLGQAVAPLHSKGVRVLVVGVGPRVNRNEVKELVKREEDMFEMSSFEDLLNKSAQLLETVCPQLPTSATTTPITTTRPPLPTPRITTTTIIESDPKCEKLFDAIFVMDSSQSINALQYGREKEFVKKLATIINVGAGSRAAVIIYSDKTQLKIQFAQHSNLDSFKLAVDALPYLQQRTRIDKALDLAAQTLNQARTGIPKAVIIMTDGRQTQEPDAVPLDVAADAIRRKGARLLVVGVGTKISENGLLEIAEDPSNLFIAQAFENLEKATRDVITSACNETEIPTMPEITTTPTPDTRSCPPLTEPPFGFCPSNRSTCFGDESCLYGKCCYDGCRFSCTSLGGIASQCVEAFDLGFAMDSSGSIREANYEKEKDFIKGLADQLDVGLQTVQLGLIVFSDVPFLLIRFGTEKSTDPSSFSDAVDKVPYFRGRTRIDSALETAANDMFPEGRQSSVPQVFFLVTDGRQSRDPGAVSLDQAVRPLQEKGIKVIVVGIGDDVDKDELRSLVENPNDDAFFVSSFDDLKGLLDEKRLVDALCISKRRRL